MAEINTVSPAYNLGTAAPISTGGAAQSAVVPAAQVQGNVTAPIYNYPVSSIYGANTNQSTPAGGKQQMSGVNIYIYNPSAIGNGQPAVVTSQPPQADAAQQPIAQQPVAATKIEPAEKADKKDDADKKPIVELTDDYIKTLESYLKSGDESLRNMGIKELVKRFEEDKTRFDNKPLTALLNIALQDPSAKNRMLAMSVIAGGNAQGDDNTVKLLQNLQNSSKMYGQEAKMANDSLLNTVAKKKFV